MTKEEFALPLNGKKNNLKRQDLVGYYGKERLGLPARLLEKVLNDFEKVQAAWAELIAISFLSPMMKEKYLQLLTDRYARLFQPSPAAGRA